MIPDALDINRAASWQLRVLLGVDETGAAAILSSGPFAAGDEDRLARLVPDAARGRLDGLAIRKRDINTADEESLAAARLDVAQIAALRARRPVEAMFDLARLPEIGPDAFGDLISVFAVDCFCYRDKLADRAVGLTAATDELLVRIRPSEAEMATRRMGGRLRAMSEEADAASARYAVYAVPQSESGAGAISRLRAERGVEETLPSFIDPDGLRRYFDPAFCLVQFADGVGRAAQEAALAGVGLSVAERHESDGLVTAALPEPAALADLERALARLNVLDAVRFAEPAFMGFDDLEDAEAGSAGGAAWHLALIGAEAAWRRGKGDPGVVVAVIDTGVDAGHPALAGGLLAREPGKSWNFESAHDPEPSDRDGHGTFIAGLIVGNGAGGVRGIAPGCRVMPLRVPLHASPAAYARRRDAILHAAEMAGRGGRVIVNLSWKTAGDVAAIRDAVEIALARGALVVASAGNWPRAESQPHYPSDYAGVISVGAVGPDGARASYSFYGAELDLAAPGGGTAGNGLVSAAPGGGVRADFGTSFAAPLVGGVAALLWSAMPGLDAGAVRAVMERTARPLAAQGMGAGLVDAPAALAAGCARRHPQRRNP